jgi:hypothetical protein
VLRSLALFAGGAIAGGAVWLVAQLRSSWAGLRVENPLSSASYFSRVRAALRAVPLIAGWRAPVSLHWIVLGVAATIAAAVVYAVTRRQGDNGATAERRGAAATVYATAVGVPLLIAVSPFATTPYVFRYYYAAGIVAAVLLAALVGHASTAIRVAFVVLLGAASFLGLRDAQTYTASRPGCRREIAPPALAPLIARLERDGVRDAWSEYWTAYRTTFAARGKLDVAPLDVARETFLTRRVEQSGTRVWVWPITDTVDDHYLGDVFRRHGVSATMNRVGDYEVYRTSAPVDPAQFPELAVPLYRQEPTCNPAQRH